MNGVTLLNWLETWAREIVIRRDLAPNESQKRRVLLEYAAADGSLQTVEGRTITQAVLNAQIQQGIPPLAVNGKPST